MEKMLSANQLSKLPEVPFGYQTILEFCKRSNHALPHIRSGKYFYVRLSVFEKWIEEEEELSVRR